MASPFDHPEAKQHFERLFSLLIGESDRGAVLVGAAEADNCLNRLFEVVIPDALPKKRRRELLTYPGPLASFAAKIELAYATRLLPRDMYDALNALRRLRNDVAHHPDTFVLKDQESRYQAIYDIGPSLPAGIRRVAFETMLDSKVEAVLKAARDLHEKDGITDSRLKSREDAVEWIRQEPEMLEVLAKQLPQWELALGIAVLCGMVIVHREAAVRLLGADATLSQVLKRSSSAGGVARLKRKQPGTT